MSNRRREMKGEKRTADERGWREELGTYLSIAWSTGWDTPSVDLPVDAISFGNDCHIYN